MIRNIQRTWFEVWGNETAQNEILKGLLLFTLVLCAVQSVCLVTLALRKPFVVAVSTSATRALIPIPAETELLDGEIRRVVTQYAKNHHEWNYSNIESQMREAAKLVHPDFEKQFNKANVDQIRIAKDKKVAQKFYIDDVTINKDTKLARITGERILNIEGLRATNPMAVEVGFAVGPRTLSNPEGVYITSEKLVQGASR